MANYGFSGGHLGQSGVADTARSHLRVEIGRNEQTYSCRFPKAKHCVGVNSGSSSVPVMQSADLGNRDDLSHLGRFYIPGQR